MLQAYAVENLRPGMIVGRDVIEFDGGVLLRKGQKLTKENICSLLDRPIFCIYIEEATEVVEIPGTTNPNDTSREDYADAAPSSGSNDDNFYWSRPHDPVSAKDAKYYFYSVYPTSESAVRPSTKVVNFSLDKTEPDKAKHLAHVSASINKKEGADPDNADAPCREQKYLEMIPKIHNY